MRLLFPRNCFTDMDNSGFFLFLFLRTILFYGLGIGLNPLHLFRF